MTPQRWTALAQLAVSAAIFGYMTQSYAVPLIALLLAAVGLTGRMAVQATPMRRIILLLTPAVYFAVMWRIAPYDNSHVLGFISFPLAYACGQYFLIVMAMQFFMHPHKPLPDAMPLLGILIMICAGDISANIRQEQVYLAAAVAEMALIATFYSCSLPARRMPGKVASGLMSLGVLAICALVGNKTAMVLQSNQRQLEQMLMRMNIYFEEKPSVGFSNEARIGSVARIKSSDANLVALRVYCSRMPGYLRAAVYEHYSDSRWVPAGEKRPLELLPEVPSQVVFPRPQHIFKTGAAPLPDNPLMMDIWPAPEVSSDYLFTPLGQLLISAGVSTLEMDANQSLAADMPPAVPYSCCLLGPAPPLSLADQHAYLQVPATLDPRVEQLARRLLSQASTTQAKIAAVQNYFTDHYRYQLGFSAPGGADPLAYFLLEQPPAHCEMFATGAAILLRLGGVPTRYVAGVVATERSGYGGYWVVRNRDAHAWVEAYDPQHGWITVEATPPDGVPHGVSQSRWTRLYDYVYFMVSKVRAFIAMGGLKILWQWLIDHVANLLLKWPSIISVVAAGGAAIAVVIVIRRRRNQGHAAVHCSDDERAMRQLLQQVDRRLAKLKIVRRDSETLHRFAKRLSDMAAENPAMLPWLPRIARWYEIYAETRYSGNPDAAMARRLRQEKDHALS